jgi:DNA-binding CsgD family transcriptional regulator/tetratricopeptide (TPR) repeat protein
VDENAIARASRVVGRDPELAALADFLGDAGSLRGFVLTGGPGIGKTTLWEAGVDAARRRGLRVLSARTSGAETQLSFAALVDLLDGVDLNGLAGLPAPQQRALEVALLRAEPSDGPADSHAVAAGFLNAMRILAAQKPVLIAIDDVQWLDAPSAEVLTFAARRLQGTALAFLLTRRPGRSPSLELALEHPAIERLEVAPLSLGAIRTLLSERLGLNVPRHLLRRLVAATMGNPLFALEIGRTLVEQELPETGEEMPLPDSIEGLLGVRVARLSPAVRSLLLAVALSGDLRPSDLIEVADETVLDDAVDAGVLIVEADRVRASHPLLAAAVKKRSRTRARRELHLRLARVGADDQLRARHLALASARADEHVAQIVAAGAAGAAARGARQEAVELGEHAVRLTPPESAQRGERLLALADYLVLAGQKQRATELLTPALDVLPEGPARARALLILATGVIRSSDDVERSFERALVESRNDPGLHSTLLARMASNTAVLRVARIAEAEAWAEKALPASRRAGRDAEQVCLDALSWTRILRGRPVDDLRERYSAISDAASYIAASPERPAAQRLAWRGEIADARALLTRLESLADERAEPSSYALLRLHLCELELRAGELRAAARRLQEWAESPERELFTSTHHRCLALLAAARGSPEEAEREAAEALIYADEIGNRWERLEALRARGTAALLAHNAASAAESLRSVWVHMQREGVDDPGVFPVAPELVEALVELGELDQARAVTDRLRELAEEQEHPWGLTSARRCSALVRLAFQAYDDEAAESLKEAAARYEELGLRVDAARSLLGAGRAQRRRRKWAAARTSLEQAVAHFEAIGSPGWADEARSELARVGGRRAVRRGALTPTELRVAELAADGLANKEIAAALFVTVHTVEVHLSRAYAKLGVRSRSQLAGRMSAANARKD